MYIKKRIYTFKSKSHLINNYFSFDMTFSLDFLTEKLLIIELLNIYL